MQMHRVAVWLLVSVLAACTEKPGAEPRRETSVSPSPTDTSAPAPTSSSTPSAPTPTTETELPALRNTVIKGKPLEKMVTVVRPLLSRVTPADGVRLMLRWEDQAPGASAPARPLAERKIDWPATFASMQLEVRKEGGPWRTLQVGAGAGRDSRPIMNIASAVVLQFDAAGLHPPDGKRHPWAKPPVQLFEGPGKYTVKVAGKLVSKTDARPFETGEIPLEVAAPSAELLPVAQVEAIAGKHFEKLEEAKGDATPKKATVDDVADNRVVRFAYHSAMGEGIFVEVVVSPAGKVVGHASKSMFTCVAQGTRIDAERGAVVVERLAVGDRVWGYDLRARRRVLTTVRAVRPAWARELVELVEGLRVTSEHPVFADGRWVLAREVEQGAGLLRADLQTLPIASPRRLHRPGQVFDLSVDWPHNFFAGGWLVHNKVAATGAIRLAFGDDWGSLLFRASTKTEWDRARRPR